MQGERGAGERGLNAGPNKESEQLALEKSAFYSYRGGELIIFAVARRESSGRTGVGAMSTVRFPFSGVLSA